MLVREKDSYTQMRAMKDLVRCCVRTTSQKNVDQLRSIPKS